MRHYGDPMASIRQVQITFDCASPTRVAHFWCEVLGYVVPPPPEGFATWGDYDLSLPPEKRDAGFVCQDPSGVGPRMYFQRVPEGKVVKNRVHLCVRVGTGLVGGGAPGRVGGRMRAADSARRGAAAPAACR